MTLTAQSKLIRTCTLLAAISAAACIVWPSAMSADSPQSETFLSDPADGHLRQNGEDGWEALRNSNDPAEVFEDLRYVKINTRTDIIYRGFLFFDTSSLPDDCELTGAVLHIYSKCTGDLDDCQLYILGGSDAYPGMPLAPGDYALPDEALPVCAHVDVGEWTELAYRTLPLEDPDTVVNKAGVTKLCLLERRDYEGVSPPDPRSENELKLYSHEEGDGFQPYLEVSWDRQPTDEQAAAAPADGNRPALGTTTHVAVTLALVGAAAIAVIARRRARRATSNHD